MTSREQILLVGSHFDQVVITIERGISTLVLPVYDPLPATREIYENHPISSQVKKFVYKRIRSGDNVFGFSHMME